MSRRNLRNPFLPLVCALAAILVFASSARAEFFDEDRPEYLYDQGEQTIHNVDLAVPAYPEDDNLREISVPNLKQFSLAVDKQSLSVGIDGVVRYSAVLTSASGTRNVFYEGINCREKTFRTFAYGTPAGKFSIRKGSRWQPLREDGFGKFRTTLREETFCSGFGYPRKLADILSRLENAGGNPFDDGESYSNFE